MYGFFTIIRSARELAAARAEVVRLAAENERTRIARDLHDVLGHSLTTITVKSALAARLVDRDPERAVQEIREVETLSRSTLGDVRAAVAGYRDVTLAGELATARHVLRSAGITAGAAGRDRRRAGARCTSCSAGRCARASPTSSAMPGRRRARSRSARRGCRSTTTATASPDIPAARPGRGTGLVGLRERVEGAGGDRLERTVVESGGRCASTRARRGPRPCRRPRRLAAADHGIGGAGRGDTGGTGRRA